MLSDLSQQIRECHERAAEARERAGATSDAALKGELLELERRWLVLARSHAFSESLDDFTHEKSRQQRDLDGAVLKPADRDEALRLQEISTLLIAESNLDSLYLRILDAAIDLMSSDMASMQVFDPERNALRLLAWEGFHPQSAAFWEWIGLDSGSSCAAALVAGGRIIVPDVETSEFAAGTPHAVEYRRSGILAMQSTPLVSRAGCLLGMISTHWRAPHQPSERALRSLDVLARQAADLIERSQAEAALKVSEERARQLAAIVESSNDSIVGTDLKRTITTWNKGAERLYGYSAEEVIGMPIAACIPEGRHHEEIAIFERIRDGERVEPFDTVRRHKDGSSIDVSLGVSPIRDLDGNIVGASSISRDITGRKRSAERIAMLAREAEHRTKNVLQAVQTVVHLSQAQTPEDLKRAIEGRIQALANAHGLFAQSRWLGADLATLVRQELAPYREADRPRARVDGPHMPVNPRVAQAIAIVLHELTTNAAKYGALSVAGGHVEVTWAARSPDRLSLIWTETDGPVIAPPSRRGFGTQVMETLIKLDLGGELRFDWRAEGLVCEIEIQL
jgi:PAS domain S-box-containing protein